MAELRAAVAREGKDSELAKLLARRLIGLRNSRKQALRHQNRMARLGVRRSEDDDDD